MSSNSNLLYCIEHIGHVNQLREELLYLSQNPSISDINKFFRSKNVKNIYLRKSREWEAEELALVKVAKALLALGSSDFSCFRKNAKKIHRAEKAVQTLNYEELFRQISSIYSSYQLTYYKRIMTEKRRLKKEILEDIGLDYLEKTPCRRDEDEIENQEWTATGQLAREKEEIEEVETPLTLKEVPKQTTPKIEAVEDYIYQATSINNPTYTNTKRTRSKRLRKVLYENTA